VQQELLDYCLGKRKIECVWLQLWVR
jgi:hypothetical protein